MLTPSQSSEYVLAPIKRCPYCGGMNLKEAYGQSLTPSRGRIHVRMECHECRLVFTETYVLKEITEGWQ